MTRTTRSLSLHPYADHKLKILDEILALQKEDCEKSRNKHKSQFIHREAFACG